MARSSRYEEVPTQQEDAIPLVASGCDTEDSLDRKPASIHHCRCRLAPNLLCLLGCLGIVTATFVFVYVGIRSPATTLVYSPAERVLHYQREIFPDAFSEVTHFMGEPSPQLDDYWKETYDLPTRIPKWQADKLEMPTIELPEDEGYYVVLLDIFHSMHCLNEIRKSLHPDYYPPYHLRMNTTEEKGRMHLDHCVEHARLALWCGADISPISFRWKEDGTSVGLSGYTHTCRDPRALLNWARQNKIRQPLP